MAKDCLASENEMVQLTIRLKLEEIADDIKDELILYQKRKELIYLTCGHCNFLQEDNNLAREENKGGINYACFGMPPEPLMMPGVNALQQPTLSVTFFSPVIAPERRACSLIQPRNDGKIIYTSKIVL